MESVYATIYDTLSIKIHGIPDLTVSGDADNVIEESNESNNTCSVIYKQ